MTDKDPKQIADAALALWESIAGKFEEDPEPTEEEDFLPEDTLFGGEGGDTTPGGDGDDSPPGGNGDDTATGGDGDDSPPGGNGDDTLNIGM